MFNNYFDLLARLYGDEIAGRIEPRLKSLVAEYIHKIPKPQNSALTEKDAILITYADQVRSDNQAPLTSLLQFSENYLKGVVSSIHVLPFFPFSSDDGFSVMDYRSIDPTLGDWEAIRQLGRSFRLMVDGVVNHASVQGKWFKAFLQEEKPYSEYFLTMQGNPDLTRVFRPRTSPLLTPFKTKSGVKNVWTTFSQDQADLDYHNPEVLLEMVDILLFYASQGAQFIRLDAIAYLWKEIGTTCVHLPQTHAIVQLLRAVLNDAAPQVKLVTETNVPHQDNISYFGNGQNEAQLVYNFALPPMVMHTLRTGDTTRLSEWAASVKMPSQKVTFLNFLASHDGIGLNPVRGILRDNEIEGLIEQTQKDGGIVSYGQDPGGEERAYELNINYFDALSDPKSNELVELQVKRFMAAQAIMLSLRGVPAIYFHSLFGSRGWTEGVKLKGTNRAINRQKLEMQELQTELNDPDALRAKVFSQYRKLLLHRASDPAFDPHSEQKIVDAGKGIFAVERFSPDGKRKTLCLQNVTLKSQVFGEYSLPPYETSWVREINK